MTIQFSQVDATEPRLLTDSSTQRSSDRSFEEKLKLEQARLGLMFSPFARFDALFNATITGASFGTPQNKALTDLYALLTEPASQPNQRYNENNATDQTTAPSPPVFAALPLQPASQGFLRQLLAQTNWLVPNLAAQPELQSAFLAGRLQPSLDLQPLIDQLVEQVRLVRSRGQTEFSLVLKPEELGEIFITLTAHSGIVSIQIKASPETKKLIDSQKSELAAALKKAQVDCDEIKIEEVNKNA